VHLIDFPAPIEELLTVALDDTTNPQDFAVIIPHFSFFLVITQYKPLDYNQLRLGVDH
jgi:hypothetical protein